MPDLPLMSCRAAGRNHAATAVAAQQIMRMEVAEDAKGSAGLTRCEQVPAAVREELESRLWSLWKRLGISFDKWAESRPVDGSTVNRYVHVRRRPPGWFISELLRDLAAAGVEIQAAERDRLWELHELLVPTTKQELKEELESVTAELRSCLEREERSSLELQEKQTRLKELDEHLKIARDRLLRDSRSQEAELVRQVLEYQQVEAERDALREQVDALRDALFHARASTEQADAERRELRRLLREAQQRARENASISSLVPDLESAPVDDLVSVVTSRAAQSPSMVTEVLRSVARLRPLADAVVLFAALHRAGRPEQAELALPSAVLGRTPYEICDLLEQLQRHGLEHYTASAVCVAVQFLSGPDLFTLAVHLRERNHIEPAGAVAAAGMVKLPLAEASDLLHALLSDREMDAVTNLASIGVAKDRHPQQLAELVRRLFAMGHHAYCRDLLGTATRVRDPRDLPALLYCLARNRLERLADDTLHQCARYGLPGLLANLIGALYVEGAGDQVQAAAGWDAQRWRPADRWWLPCLERPIGEVAAVISELGVGFRDLSLDLFDQFLVRRPAAESRALIADVRRASPAGWSDFVERYTLKLDTGQACSLLRLLGAEFPQLTVVVVRTAARRQAREEWEELLSAIPLKALAGDTSVGPRFETGPKAIRELASIAETRGYDDLASSLRSGCLVAEQQYAKASRRPKMTCTWPDTVPPDSKLAAGFGLPYLGQSASDVEQAVDFPSALPDEDGPWAVVDETECAVRETTAAISDISDRRSLHVRPQPGRHRRRR